MKHLSTLKFAALAALLATPATYAADTPTPAGPAPAPATEPAPVAPAKTPAQLALDELQKYYADEAIVAELSGGKKSALTAWRNAPKQVARREQHLRNLSLIGQLDSGAARRLAHDYERHLDAKGAPIAGAPDKAALVAAFRAHDKRHYLFRHAPISEVLALPPADLPTVMHILSHRRYEISRAQRDAHAKAFCAKAEHTGQTHGDYIGYARNRVKALDTLPAIEWLQKEIKSHIGLPMDEEERRRTVTEWLSTIELLRELAGLPKEETPAATAPTAIPAGLPANAANALRESAAPITAAMRTAGIAVLPADPAKYSSLDFWRKRLAANPATPPAEWARYYAAATAATAK